MLTNKLNAIASLSDPEAIAKQLKAMSNREAVYIALYCAIEWVDINGFVAKIMSALDVPKQEQDRFSQKSFHNSDKKMIQFISCPTLRTEYSAWAALYSVRAINKIYDYRKMGHLANLALKQMEAKV